jgi:hypothetical protein
MPRRESRLELPGGVSGRDFLAATLIYTCCAKLFTQAFGAMFGSCKDQHRLGINIFQ